jgi:HK97 family phage portal protein
VATRLLLANNVFILPDWNERGNLSALWPLPFTFYNLAQRNGQAVITFNAAREFTFPYEDIIHLQRFPQLTGGAQLQATGNYSSIISTLQEQAVKDSVNNQRIAALLQTKTALKGPDMQKRLAEFKSIFLSSENTTGFGMISGDIEIHELRQQKLPLNKDLLESIVGYLYNYFGASKEIITNTATELQNDQFINNTILPIVYQIEEELSYKLFSGTELAHNNRILAETVDLEISTLTAKTSFFKEMIFGGVMSRNEVRRRVGLPRGPKELDEFQSSKNFQEVLPPGNYTVEGGEKGGQEAAAS